MKISQDKQSLGRGGGGKRTEARKDVQVNIKELLRPSLWCRVRIKALQEIEKIKLKHKRKNTKPSFEQDRPEFKEKVTSRNCGSKFLIVEKTITLGSRQLVKTNFSALHCLAKNDILLDEFKRSNVGSDVIYKNNALSGIYQQNTVMIYNIATRC